MKFKFIEQKDSGIKKDKYYKNSKIKGYTEVNRYRSREKKLLAKEIA